MSSSRNLKTFYDIVQNHAVAHGSKVAICHRVSSGNYTLTTYKELAEKARAFAELFRHMVPTVSIIPMYAGKSAESIAAMLGAVGADKAFAFLNPKFRVSQIEAILDLVKPPVVLVDGPGLLGLKTMSSAQIASRSLAWLILRGENFSRVHERAADRLASEVSMQYVSAVLRGLPMSHWPMTTVNVTQPGCCLFTSGSTGAPKGVLISQADLLARVDAEIDTYGLTAADVLLSILPFSFDVGLNQLLTALVVGCELIILDSWLPMEILDVTAERGVTGISGVPTIWSEMLRYGIGFSTTHQHRSLRYLTISGGSLPPSHLDKMPELAENVAIFKTYGQTEAFRATCLMPADFNTKRLSVGRPFAGVRVYVVRDDGTSCAANEMGEVVHSGLGMMLGYLGGNEARNKLRPNPFHGTEDSSPQAVFTGDYGYFDEDGYLFLKGRRDTMLKVSGNRIYPHEIASQMVSIKGIAEAEVIGLKDKVEETRLVGFVVTDGSRELDPAVIRRELSVRVASYMVPSEIVFLPSMPHTASGKTDYPRLHEVAQRQVGSDYSAL